MGAGAVRNLMQAAVKLSGLSVFLRLAAVAVAFAAGGSVYSARAQTPQADGPPVAIGGWRYEKGANDVHLFHCEMAACVPGSRVSYRFYAAGTTLPFAQYRSEQEMVVKALQQRAAPGTKITIVAIEGDDTATLPRMYKTRRLTIQPDGSQEHVHSGILMGERASVSLISSSRDEKAATGSYAQYALGLMLVIQMPKDTKK
jgi:uncharacterized protein YndB with AHSA1/START domain